MNFTQNSWRLLALVVCFSLARGAHATQLTAYGVDSSLGGQMDFAAGQQSPVNSPIVFTAQNFSGSTTYHGVGLALEFFYPADANGNATGNGYIYEGGGIWGDTGNPTTDTQELDITGVLAPYSSVLETVPSPMLVPLTDSHGGFTASMGSGDSIPLIELGDFAPGQQMTFDVTFTQPKGGAFRFLTDSFFVAVPEPSSIAMAIIGGISLLFAGRRRAMRKSQI